MDALVTTPGTSLATVHAAPGTVDVRCQAHDLKNKLTVIVGYCDLLHASGDGLDRQRAARMIGNIRAAAEQSARIAAAMMAPRAAAAVSAVDLNALVVEEAGALCQDLLRQGINLHVERTPRLPSVRVDPLWLARTLLNLAHNARDAILAQPNRGRAGIIRFATSLPPVKSTPPLVLLTVADNGPGIATDALELIWQPGWSTKDAGGPARGYGLASVRAFVEDAGGFIDVDSRPGEGTEFSLLLPAESSD